MQAVRAHDRGVEVVDVPRPTGDGVRVRVRAAGICGSDLHLIEMGFALGHTLGHEMAGLTPDGTPVAIEPLLSCGQCANCMAGAYNLCDLGAAILGIAHDGGMAEEIVVPEHRLVPLHPAVPVTNASLVEPLAVVVHGLRRAGLRGGERVAVVGGGSIGLCSVVAAHAAGAHVDLVARHDTQRAAGERLGAGEASDTYDLVIDAAGTKSALETALPLARPGARLLLVATYWGGLELPGFPLCLKEVDVIPASLYGREGASRDVDVAASILAQDPAIADAIITHRFPLDAAREAFATAADRKSGAIKVVLEPG